MGPKTKPEKRRHFGMLPRSMGLRNKLPRVAVLEPPPSPNAYFRKY